MSFSPFLPLDRSLCEIPWVRYCKIISAKRAVTGLVYSLHSHTMRLRLAHVYWSYRCIGIVLQIHVIQDGHITFATLLLRHTRSYRLAFVKHNLSFITSFFVSFPLAHGNYFWLRLFALLDTKKDIVATFFILYLFELHLRIFHAVFIQL